MSNSYIQFQGHGFWCPDSLLEVFAYLVGSELRPTSRNLLGNYGAELVEKAREATAMKANPIALTREELGEILERAM